jgi:hypothetical protein
MALNHYTKVYDNFLSDNVCDQYVKYFEETMVKDRAEVIDTSICYGKEVGAAGQPICGNCNCQRMNPMGFDRFIPLNKIALNQFLEIVDRYRKDVDLHKSQWPVNHGYEEFRMKRFLVSDGGPDSEQFKDHVDVTSHEGGKRFLIMMVYLNDDFEGGETVFPILGDTIKPKKGRLLLFPPTWNYLHHGNPPLKPGYAKYFLMTYLNYTDMQK